MQKTQTSIEELRQWAQSVRDRRAADLRVELQTLTKDATELVARGAKALANPQLFSKVCKLPFLLVKQLRIGLLFSKFYYHHFCFLIHLIDTAVICN